MSKADILIVGDGSAEPAFTNYELTVEGTIASANVPLQLISAEAQSYGNGYKAEGDWTVGSIKETKMTIRGGTIRVQVTMLLRHQYGAGSVEDAHGVAKEVLGRIIAAVNARYPESDVYLSETGALVFRGTINLESNVDVPLIVEYIPDYEERVVTAVRDAEARFRHGNVYPGLDPSITMPSDLKEVFQEDCTKVYVTVAWIKDYDHDDDVPIGDMPYAAQSLLNAVSKAIDEVLERLETDAQGRKEANEKAEAAKAAEAEAAAEQHADK